MKNTPVINRDGWVPESHFSTNRNLYTKAKLPEILKLLFFNRKYCWNVNNKFHLAIISYKPVFTHAVNINIYS